MAHTSWTGNWSMKTPSLAFCSMSWYIQNTGDNDVSLNFRVLHHETTLDSSYREEKVLTAPSAPIWIHTLPIPRLPQMCTAMVSFYRIKTPQDSVDHLSNCTVTKTLPDSPSFFSQFTCVRPVTWSQSPHAPTPTLSLSSLTFADICSSEFPNVTQYWKLLSENSNLRMVYIE